MDQRKLASFCRRVTNTEHNAALVCLRCDPCEHNPFDVNWLAILSFGVLWGRTHSAGCRFMFLVCMSMVLPCCVQVGESPSQGVTAEDSQASGAAEEVLLEAARDSSPCSEDCETTQVESDSPERSCQEQVDCQQSVGAEAVKATRVHDDVPMSIGDSQPHAASVPARSGCGGHDAEDAGILSDVAISATPSDVDATIVPQVSCNVNASAVLSQEAEEPQPSDAEEPSPRDLEATVTASDGSKACPVPSDASDVEANSEPEADEPNASAPDGAMEGSPGAVLAHKSTSDAVERPASPKHDTEAVRSDATAPTPREGTIPKKEGSPVKEPQRKTRARARATAPPPEPPSKAPGQGVWGVICDWRRQRELRPRADRGAPGELMLDQVGNYFHYAGFKVIRGVGSGAGAICTCFWGSLHQRHIGPLWNT